MCEIIRKFTGSYSDRLSLTKASPAIKAIHNATMCPRGFCARGITGFVCSFSIQSSQMPVTYKLQCDEFSFAISTEVGNPSTGLVFCAEAWQIPGKGGDVEEDQFYKCWR